MSMLAPRRLTIAAPIVSIRPWQRLEQARTVLQELLADLYGAQRPVRPGGTIVIKPNITANAPSSSGGTTHVKRGALGWLPDMARSLARAAALLRPSGQILIHGTHPVCEMLPFDDEKEADPARVGEPYFKAAPHIESGELDYVRGTEHVSALSQDWFVHTPGAIDTELVRSGLAIVSLEEHPRDISVGHRRQEQAGIPIPLSYVLLAQKSAPNSR